jgi:hypothetical protein
MDHDGLVDHWRERCKGLIETIMQAPDLHSVASASRAIRAQMRPVGRDILQAKIALEARQLRRADVMPCCQEAGVTWVQTRTVRPETLVGEITIPVRTFQCRGGGATVRPDDPVLGVPETGDFTDAVRSLDAPLAAELPQRVAHTLCARGMGVALSSCGAQAIIDSTAEDLRTGQAARESREAEGGGGMGSGRRGGGAAGGHRQGWGHGPHRRALARSARRHHPSAAARSPAGGTDPRRGPGPSRRWHPGRGRGLGCPHHPGHA